MILVQSVNTQLARHLVQPVNTQLARHLVQPINTQLARHSRLYLTITTQTMFFPHISRVYATHFPPVYTESNFPSPVQSSPVQSSPVPTSNPFNFQIPEPSHAIPIRSYTLRYSGI